jgi:ribonucleoside-diphosphate reductase beta chain
MSNIYEEDEPILTENKQRFVMFPIKYDKVWEMYQKHKAMHWVAEEVELAYDIKDWNTKLNDSERHYIKHVLAFFAASDGIVGENLALRFLKEIQIPEVRAFYSLQLFMEQIHSEMYSLLIDTYIKDEADKSHLFNAIETVPVIAQKAEWAIKHINSPRGFAHRLVAFAAVEGIFFSGSFCSIFYMKKRSLLPGLCKSNEYISRDEGLHCDFACLLYTTLLKHKLPESEVQAIIREAVEIEKLFVTDALPVSLIGMNARLMQTYVEFVADRLLVALDVLPIYHVKNPFDWMEMISLTTKSNFFEKRPSEYAKVHVMETLQHSDGDSNNNNKTFTFDTEEEF